MLHSSHAVWGIVMVALLIGFLLLRRFIGRRAASGRGPLMGFSGERIIDLDDVEHRALMFLVNQKLDAVLAAMARTIDEERQKLGGAVMDPSREPIAAGPTPTAQDVEPQGTPYEHALMLHRQGLSVAMIARRLALSEAEVALVTRLNAA